MAYISKKPPDNESGGDENRLSPDCSDDVDQKCYDKENCDADLSSLIELSFSCVLSVLTEEGVGAATADCGVKARFVCIGEEYYQDNSYASDYQKNTADNV